MVLDPSPDRFSLVGGARECVFEAESAKSELMPFRRVQQIS